MTTVLNRDEILQEVQDIGTRFLLINDVVAYEAASGFANLGNCIQSDQIFYSSLTSLYIQLIWRAHIAVCNDSDVINNQLLAELIDNGVEITKLFDTVY